MNYTMAEVLQFVEENDVKFIRLAFCDIFGIQKNISIMPNELPRAFETGISFDASAICGFMNIEESDLFLVPDPTTLAVLPWRPSQGRVVRFFCNIMRPDGTNFEGDGRNILRASVKKAKNLGYSCNIGTECEFYLFEKDENGIPTKNPFDNAGYFDIAPLDKGENVRREICLTLEEMGIIPESSHHEQGPGQNEIVFKHSDALSAADNLVTFKSVVKTIAARDGLHASFMPKPFESKSGSGLHINISLFKNSINVFKNEGDENRRISESFIAGIMDKINDITAFLNPTTNSYHRLGSFEAPSYITWSHQNRSQLIRIPAAKGEHRRIELRSPDPTCNPYIAFALLISAGLLGIENNLTLCQPTDYNLYTADSKLLEGIKMLPKNLEDALMLAHNSEFVKSVIPAHTIKKYIDFKRAEWNLFCEAEDKDLFENKLYFEKL